MSNCHYGCWFGRRCLGYTRAEVVEFLAEHCPETDWATRTDDDLDAALLDMMDVDYRGPDHVRRSA